MKDLIKTIQDKTVHNIDEIQESIIAMVCAKNDLIPLEENKITDALNIHGEFLVLKLHYDDFEDELKNESIKYKISQSLSIIVTYEDDACSYAKIGDFVEYIYKNTDAKQNAIFGVKKVKKLSKYPITILFTGILPINQLKMTIGQKVYDIINSDDEYFKEKFKKYRDLVSEDINVPLLPLLPILDSTLGDFRIRLLDTLDGRVISEFDVCSKVTKDMVDIYLDKLSYVYRILADEKNCKGL